MLARTRFVRFVVPACCLVLTVEALAKPGNAQSWSLDHAGTIFDAFTLNGNEIWTVEDGGRIRHRTGTATNYTWSFFQSIPARDLLYRVEFLDNGTTGWAVGLDGWFMALSSTGLTHPAFQLGGSSAHLKLWDFKFIDTLHGWLLEEHGLYQTTNGGLTAQDWSQTGILFLDKGGNPISTSALQKYKFFALDIVPGPVSNPPPPLPSILGLVCAQPGLIFRSTDGAVWQLVFDIRDLCVTGSLPTCMQGICANPPPLDGFQPWDVEISRNPSSPLALMAGGLATGCGMIFGSTDNGLTWQSEPHECQCTQPGCHAGPCAGAGGDPDYLPDTVPPVPGHTWRLSTLNTIYSVSIFDGDNSAIAGGYSGQHLKRDPVTRVWKDRSHYSNNPVNAPSAVLTPMYATAANGGGAASGTAVGMIGGAGGVIEHTTDGGNTWNTEVAGDPWRPRDLCFIDNNTGWVVGQNLRIAKTTDAGQHWNDSLNHVTPDPDMHGRSLMGIAMNSLGNGGVAVGQSDLYSVSFPDRPKILYTTQSSGLAWSEPQTVSDVSQGASDNWELRAVCWAGGTTYWAAGQKGLIYQSVDGGATWNFLLPPGETWPAFNQFEMQGVAFRDATTGIFVGTRPGPKAYVYVGGASPTWTDITPTDPSITMLTDVDVALNGNVAYAVGVKLVGTAVSGVILVSTYSSGQFSTFVPVSPHPTIPACQIGEDLGVVPVLNRVKIAGSDIWVGGECGRVWHGSNGSTWTEVLSKTDAHIRGLSFSPGGNLFAAALRNSTPGYSIMRYQ